MRANRSLTQTAIVVLIVGGVLEGVAIVGGLIGEFHILAAAVFIAGILMAARARRCPNCKKDGLGLHPFGKNAGYCRCCGKLIEFDDGKWG